MSPLSLRVLAWAQQQVAAHIQGGLHPYGRFRSPDIDDYMDAVGLPNPPDIGVQGEPWCASAIYYGYATCETPSEPSRCPRTPSALHMAFHAPPGTKLTDPVPGAVGIIDRGHGRGHVVIVEAVGPLSGQVTTVEPDTNAAFSTRGDAWGRHTWEPYDTNPETRRGDLVGWFDFGAPPPAT